MKYACWSVVGGWVTASVNAEGELVAGEEAGIEPDCYEQERTSRYR